MLAVPLDNKEALTLSTLYGNAPFFALLEENSMTIIKNEELGKGPKIPAFLKTKGATATLFYHMGEGVYKGCVKASLEVYTANKQAFALSEILSALPRLTKLNEQNYKSLLDSGTTECKCGCNE